MKLIIPIEPPSGNHYKSVRVIANHVSWYLTAAAKAWHEAVALEVRDAGHRLLGTSPEVRGKAHRVHYTVFQGPGSRGDVDNYAKCILDSLVKAGVLKSDASVVSLHCHKQRDRDNPRTEITVEAI